MDIQAIQDEIGYLLQTMEKQPEDARELYLQIHEKLNELRAFGMPVPDDLQALEQTLQTRFTPPSSGGNSGGNSE